MHHQVLYEDHVHSCNYSYSDAPQRMTPKQDGFKLFSFCKRCHVLSHGNTVFVYTPVRNDV